MIKNKQFPVNRLLIIVNAILLISVFVFTLVAPPTVLAQEVNDSEECQFSSVQITPNDDVVVDMKTCGSQVFSLDGFEPVFGIHANGYGDTFGPDGIRATIIQGGDILILYDTDLMQIDTGDLVPVQLMFAPGDNNPWLLVALFEYNGLQAYVFGNDPETAAQAESTIEPAEPDENSDPSILELAMTPQNVFSAEEHNIVSFDMTADYLAMLTDEGTVLIMAKGSNYVYEMPFTGFTNVHYVQSTGELMIGSDTAMFLFNADGSSQIIGVPLYGDQGGQITSTDELLIIADGNVLQFVSLPDYYLLDELDLGREIIDIDASGDVLALILEDEDGNRGLQIIDLSEIYSNE